MAGILDIFLGESKTQKKVQGESKLKTYERHLADGSYLTMSFDQVGADGVLSAFDDGIKIIMQPDQITGQVYNPRYRSKVYKQQYMVKVVNVDRENKLVEVSHHKAREEQRPAVEAEIERLLKQEGQVIVKAKIRHIARRKVDIETIDTGLWLDICGVGIRGYLHISDWSPVYTHSFDYECEVGDVITVLIKEKREHDDGYHYACSRKEVIENPWENEEMLANFKKGSVVQIMCVQCEDNHWFGTANGLDGIRIYVDYPDIQKFKVWPGKKYSGIITKLAPEERQFRAKVFEEIED